MTEASKGEVMVGPTTVQFIRPPDDAQRFFAAYATEIRGPNYGDHARDFVRTMLARAELAGIYTPETP